MRRTVTPTNSRAASARPKLVIADEPVSALDVSVQSQILNLMSDLKEEMGMAYLFIAHDLAVVQHMSDRVAVMYLGSVVEQATRDKLFSEPKHPYTQALMVANPVPGLGKRKNRARRRAAASTRGAPTPRTCVRRSARP
jgi:oligopeptide transport system ATP-binding protein